MINEIIVHEHKVALGRNSDEHRILADFAKNTLRNNLPSLQIDVVDMYNMGGYRHSHAVGSGTRLVFFLNATSADTDEKTATDVVAGGYAFNAQLLKPQSIGKLIKSENDVILAEHIEVAGGLNLVNVYFDVLAEDSEQNRKVFEFIVRELERTVFLPKTYATSWKHTEERDVLTASFTEAMKRSRMRHVETDKQKIREYEQQITQYQSQLKNTYDNLIRRRVTVEAHETQLDTLDAGLLRDLDNIVAHDKIRDMHIKDGKFIIHTEPIFFYHDKNGDRYYGGEYRIEIKPDNTEIKFFGNNGRRGYWTGADPHPHIDGGSGRACLGNISATIAELCSQMQIYALVMVAIDFLENINTEDPAGRRYTSWDRVDAEGNVIEYADGREVDDDDDDDDEERYDED